MFSGSIKNNQRIRFKMFLLFTLSNINQVLLSHTAEVLLHLSCRKYYTLMYCMYSKKRHCDVENIPQPIIYFPLKIRIL